MKNLVKLTSGELDIVCGGGEAIQVGLCCSFPGIIFNYIADRKNSIESLSVEELITSSLISISIHIAEFAAICEIGKGLKKLIFEFKKIKKNRKNLISK